METINNDQQLSTKGACLNDYLRSMFKERKKGELGKGRLCYNVPVKPVTEMWLHPEVARTSEVFFQVLHHQFHLMIVNNMVRPNPFMPNRLSNMGYCHTQHTSEKGYRIISC